MLGTKRTLPASWQMARLSRLVPRATALSHHNASLSPQFHRTLENPVGSASHFPELHHQSFPSPLWPPWLSHPISGWSSCSVLAPGSPLSTQQPEKAPTAQNPAGSSHRTASRPHACGLSDCPGSHLLLISASHGDSLPLWPNNLACSCLRAFALATLCKHTDASLPHTHHSQSPSLAGLLCLLGCMDHLCLTTSFP